MKAKFKLLRETVLQRYKTASPRERSALVLLAAALLGIAGYQVYDAAAGVFAEQAAQLEKVNSDRRALPFVLERYLKLESKKQAIEEGYREVQAVDEPVAQLETVLKSKEAVDKNFSINDAEPKRFGTNYEQHSFAVRFTISDFPQLVGLLQDLTIGPKSFVLKSLRVTKTRGGQRLEVDLDLSSIKRVKA